MSSDASKKSLKLNAVMMRWLLSVLLLLLLTGAGAGFYFSYQYLVQIAKETSDARASADSADSKLQQLRLLGAALKKHEADVKKAEQVVASAKSYQYQNQIVEDLTRYAAMAGVSIQSFTFQNETAGKKTTGSNTSPSTGDAAQNSSANQSQSAAPALKSVHVTVQLGAEVEYRRLLHLIHLIEQNLTRMQLQGLQLARNDKNPQAVSSQALNLEVYIR